LPNPLKKYGPDRTSRIVKKLAKVIDVARIGVAEDATKEGMKVPERTVDTSDQSRA